MQDTVRNVLVTLTVVAASGLLLTAGSAVYHVGGSGSESTAGRTVPDGGRRAPPTPAPASAAPHAATADDEPSAPDRRVAVLPAYHRVEAGETLWSIAERYALDPDELARSNAIDDADAIPVGARLVLPDPTAERPATVAEARSADLRVARVLEEVAAEFGWRAATVKAVAWAESRWIQAAISSEGAVGVMQVHPATGEMTAARLDRDLDLYDLRDNVTAGVAYLDHLHERFDGDMRATLSAYHQGPTALRHHSVYPVTERYVDEVLELRERFGR